MHIGVSTAIKVYKGYNMMLTHLAVVELLVADLRPELHQLGPGHEGAAALLEGGLF